MTAKRELRLKVKAIRYACLGQWPEVNQIITMLKQYGKCNQEFIDSLKEV